MTVNRKHLADMLMKLRKDKSQHDLIRTFIQNEQVVSLATSSFDVLRQAVDQFCQHYSVAADQVYLHTTTIPVPYEDWDDDAVVLTTHTRETDLQYYNRIAQLYQALEDATDVRLINGTEWRVEIIRAAEDVRVVDVNDEVVLSVCGSGSTEQRIALANQLAAVLNQANNWLTADDLFVQPGDAVYVHGSTGVQRAKVIKPCTSYDLFGPVLVSDSYVTDPSVGVD